MASNELISKLTEREKVCLRLWLEHKTAKEIAADLGITHHAVEKRLKMARAKLGTSSSLTAARILNEAERSNQTVAQSPDLSGQHQIPHGLSGRMIVLGGIVTMFIAATLLALVMPHIPEQYAHDQNATLAQANDETLDVLLEWLISSAEIGPDGEVSLNQNPGDPRFLVPESGYYWQISALKKSDFKSRSLWDRSLRVPDTKGPERTYSTSQHFPKEPLRIAKQTIVLPGSDVRWTFMVARPLTEQR